MAKPNRVEIQSLPAIFRFDRRGRLVVSLSGRQFAMDVIELPDPRLSTIEALLRVKKPHVIIAPHLSDSAKSRIEDRGWSWIESDGNAHVVNGGVFVHIERPGEPAPKRTGSLVIPPQGERIVRHLLDNYPRSNRFTDIARATQLDRGYTSRILARLRRSGLISYVRNKPVEVTYPAELFEAWQSSASRVVESPWFVPKPTDTEVLALRLADSPKRAMAFTGTFGASLLTRHFEPERVEAYVDGLSTATEVAERLGGQRASTGFNVLFLVHRDPGVLSIGTRTVRRLQVVSPSQVYRDALQRGRGREREAANQFRREVLSW